MSERARLRVVVAGAGAVGLCIALRLATGDHAVTLCDPSPIGANASGVAAGMLAPAFECVLEPDLAAHFDLFRAARNLWRTRPYEAVENIARGALGLASPSVLQRWRQVMTGLGAPVSRAEPVEGLSWTGGGLFTTEDWRLDARAALANLHAAFLRAGGEMRSASVLAFGDGEVRLSDGSRLAADRLVAATGASLGLAPELARLLPIKGQIVRVEGVSIRSPVIRAEGVYIAPTRGGAMIGATMEPGRADLEVEPAVVAALCHRAFEIAPALREGRATGLAGVRAATPDGLPLVGWSAEPGVLVAAGARRNGWLLAPLMAEEIIAALAGAAGGLYAARLAASRSS